MVQASWWSRAKKFLRGSARTASSEPAPRERTASGGSPAPRLVIETDVFLKAVQAPQSACRRVLEAISDGRAALLVDPQVFSEYRQRLQRDLSSGDEQSLSRSWISQAEAVPANGRSMQHTGQHDKFVALARAGKADAIVTNDEHRLRLRNRLDIPVLRPDEALRMIADR